MRHVDESFAYGRSVGTQRHRWSCHGCRHGAPRWRLFAVDSHGGSCLARNGLLLAGGIGRRAATPSRAAAEATAAPAASGRYRVAYRPMRPSRGDTASVAAAQPNEHPLMPALRWAYAGLANIEKIQGLLGHDGQARADRRQAAASTSTCSSRCGTSRSASTCTSSARPDLKGQEVIYVEGQNNGNMWAHAIGHPGQDRRHGLAEARRTDRHAEPALSDDRDRACST